MPAHAYLWSNGNAMFFDEKGQQIPELQQHRWSGLHGFVKRYPDALVQMGDWRGGVFEVRSVPQLLRSLRRPHWWSR